MDKKTVFTLLLGGIALIGYAIGLIYFVLFT